MLLDFRELVLPKTTAAEITPPDPTKILKISQAKLQANRYYGCLTMRKIY